jgi:hypothetical protein
MVGEDGIEVLILLSAKVNELFAVLKEELYGPSLGIDFYYLMAAQGGIGAQKDHPLIGLFGFGKHHGYRFKVRDLHYKGAGVKVEGGQIAHLLFSHQFVEPLQGVGLPSVQVPHIVPLHLTHHLIANPVDGLDELGRGEPAIKEHKDGIYAMVPRPLHHLDEEIGLFPEDLLSPPGGDCAFVHCLREGAFRPLRGGMDTEIERKQGLTIKVADYQMAHAKHGTANRVIPHIGGQFNPFSSFRVDGVIGNEEPFSQSHRLHRCDGLEAETNR